MNLEHTDQFPEAFRSDRFSAADSPRFTMLLASDGRLAATMTTCKGTLGRPLFEIFPDANPENPEPFGVENLRTSLETVLRTRAPPDTDAAYRGRLIAIADWSRDMSISALGYAGLKHPLPRDEMIATLPPSI